MEALIFLSYSDRLTCEGRRVEQMLLGFLSGGAIVAIAHYIPFEKGVI
ncbi:MULTISPECIES: hypothetical protein [unclassified Leptolyngbya]|nr:MULTISPECIES: hypothetical protein [unclassified Leptolyngbya]MBD1911873.1 hypothetical protein [Leptolyngbya sp. FACHB-8]MBD2156082.1 hypothetical protein [Leptolyngbya sp. FACHB-16]